MKRNEVITILISGGDSWVNLGDNAILEGTIELLKKLSFPIEILILSGNSRVTKQNYPQYQIINRNNLCSLLVSIGKADVVVWGGGHLIQNTSSKLFLGYQLFILILAILHHKILIGFALGAEEINGRLWRYITKLILNKFFDISVRDTFSLKYLHQLGVKVPIRISADPAVILKPSLVTSQELNILSQEPFVLIAPRKWFDYQSSFLPVRFQRKLFNRNSLEFTTLLQKFAKISDWIIENYHFKVYFMPMYPGNNQDDERVSKQIIDLMEHKELTNIISGLEKPCEIIGFFANAELLLGMRMHATILGACANVPIIGINYQNKGGSFFDSLNLTHFAIPIEDFNIMNTIELIKEVLSNRSQIKSSLDRQMIKLSGAALLNLEGIKNVREANRNEIQDKPE